ncbi:protein arginine kinase [Sporosarcina sp. Marseille-Q4063]|uniref:protein arginine kinase n=1 Tax=Sporosarcina sp. Marseille-Q4063 TaxID=2810514 RepID=UPI001BAFAC9B|nr:protein arginine kinase [Sporosarcina sp. Marseille-Q4063]QUW20405.1 protein arginine kinase [Sporosarcina sp. Marseille-Q4063]
MSIEKFIQNAATGWMTAHGENSDIVLSTRIRLARNLRGYKFPIAANDDEALAVDKIVSGTLLDNNEDDYTYSRMSELSSLDREVLVEKHLVSPHLTNPDRHGAVLLSSDESISVMVNEEDHIRIQCIYPGLQLEEAFEKANHVDDILEKELPYAFDEDFGYLTSCPSNTGTGMRASVMMHLPALTITKQIDRIIPAIGRLGLVVRGSYGEGSKALGNVYQVSNQVTLGKTEADILEDLSNITSHLLAHERRARKLLVEKSQIALEDRLFRSLGTLVYSRLLQTGEAARCLSDVRLGIDLGIIKDVDMTILNELMIFMQPGFLQQFAQTDLTQEERDIFRAKLFRKRLAIDGSRPSTEKGTEE